MRDVSWRTFWKMFNVFPRYHDEIVVPLSWTVRWKTTEFVTVKADKMSHFCVKRKQLTLTQNLAFLPRDAMHKRGLCHVSMSCGVCLSVSMSVCLPVTFVDSVETNKRIFKNFSPWGSHTILVFPHQTSWRYSDNPPPSNGSVECRWGRQKSRFWPNIWLHRVLWTLWPALRWISSFFLKPVCFTICTSSLRNSTYLLIYH